MSLAHGRHFLSIPGPSVMPERVLNAMHRGAPNIYEGALPDMVAAMTEDLKAVARTAAGRVAIYVSNGHGAWEAALANLFAPGDRILVLDCGRFAEGWGQMAERLGLEVELIRDGDRRAVDPQRLEDRLRADTAGAIKGVLVVQVDTASSILNDIPALRAAIDAAGHPALFCVDCIACLGCIPFEMDAWGADVMVSGSQKGLMTPPGLGFVWIGPKAWAASPGPLASGYWDWRLRAEPEMFYQRFAGTAPTHLLFGLREALTMLLHEEGLENAWARHRVLAGAARACVAGWAEGGAVGFAVEEDAHRSDVVTMVAAPGLPDPDGWRVWLERETNLTLGTALGSFHGTGFRIAHMGHLNPPMILGTLGTAEAGLRAAGVAVGAGVSRAAEAIAAALPAPELAVARAAE